MIMILMNLQLPERMEQSEPIGICYKPKRLLRQMKLYERLPQERKGEKS